MPLSSRANLVKGVLYMRVRYLPSDKQVNGKLVYQITGHDCTRKMNRAVRSEGTLAYLILWRNGIWRVGKEVYEEAD